MVVKKRRGRPKNKRKTRPPKIANIRRLICGRSGSGKTYWLMTLLTKWFFTSNKQIKPQWKDKFYFLVVQPTFQTNTIYKEFPHIKKIFKSPKYGEVFEQWNVATGDRILKVLETYHGKRQVVVILDDLAGKNSVKFGPPAEALKKLAISITHIGGYLFSLWQRYDNAPIDLRANTDIVDMFYSTIHRELKTYHDAYFGLRFGFPDFKTWFVRVIPNSHDVLTIKLGNGPSNDSFYVNGKLLGDTTLNTSKKL